MDVGHLFRTAHIEVNENDRAFSVTPTGVVNDLMILAHSLNTITDFFDNKIYGHMAEDPEVQSVHQLCNQILGTVDDFTVKMSSNINSKADECKISFLSLLNNIQKISNVDDLCSILKDQSEAMKDLYVGDFPQSFISPSEFVKQLDDHRSAMEYDVVDLPDDESLTFGARAPTPRGSSKFRFKLKESLFQPEVTKKDEEVEEKLSKMSYPLPNMHLKRGEAIVSLSARLTKLINALIKMKFETLHRFGQVAKNSNHLTDHDDRIAELQQLAIDIKAQLPSFEEYTSVLDRKSDALFESLENTNTQRARLLKNLVDETETANSRLGERVKQLDERMTAVTDVINTDVASKERAIIDSLQDLSVDTVKADTADMERRVKQLSAFISNSISDIQLAQNSVSGQIKHLANTGMRSIQHAIDFTQQTTTDARNTISFQLKDMFELFDEFQTKYQTMADNYNSTLKSEQGKIKDLTSKTKAQQILVREHTATSYKLKNSHKTLSSGLDGMIFRASDLEVAIGSLETSLASLGVSHGSAFHVMNHTELDFNRSVRKITSEKGAKLLGIDSDLVALGVSIMKLGNRWQPVSEDKIASIESDTMSEVTARTAQYSFVKAQLKAHRSGIDFSKTSLEKIIEKDLEENVETSEDEETPRLDDTILTTPTISTLGAANLKRTNSFQTLETPTGQTYTSLPQPLK
ncbi:hypothetical protein PCE1_000755 [Barthelona sp. PCE]